MRIPFSQSIDKRASDLPKIKEFPGKVLAVEFPSRTLQVVVSNQRVTARAVSTIDFGTTTKPLISRGMKVWVQHDESTGDWIATQLDSLQTCNPTTISSVPNVPLPTYNPPKTTFPGFPPFPVNLPPFPNMIPLQVPPTTRALPKPKPVPWTLPQGNGNLLYVSTLQGLARCDGAYSGTQTWTNLSTGLSTNAKKIRWFTFDPFSKSVDHFTKIWAMTDDGLYLVTGLPTTPVWTQKLSLADAATLVGWPASNIRICNQFALSTSTANSLQVMVITDKTSVGGYFYMYTLSSSNGGTTWTTDTNIALGMDSSLANTQSLLRLNSSGHISGRFLMHGSIGIRSQILSGSETQLYNVNHHVGVMYRKTAPYYYYGFATYQGIDGTGCAWTFPYCNTSGSVYSNDTVGYSYGHAHGSTGTNAIRRYTTLENPLWRSSVVNDYRASTNIGDSSMNVSTVGEILYFFTNMASENYMGAMNGTHLWFSSTKGSAWTHVNNPAIDSSYVAQRYFSNLPKYGTLWYGCGARTSGSGIASVWKTTNGGTSFTDISKRGSADGIDTVMGLTLSSELDHMYIQTDYNKV